MVTIKQLLKTAMKRFIVTGLLVAMPNFSTAEECGENPRECFDWLQAKVGTLEKTFQILSDEFDHQCTSAPAKVEFAFCTLLKDNRFILIHADEKEKCTAITRKCFGWLQKKIQTLVKKIQTLTELLYQHNCLNSDDMMFCDRLKDSSFGPEMVWIPAGKFRMGDIQGGGNPDKQPVHEVSIKRFAMSRFEVTFVEYDKFAEATGREKPNDQGWGRGNRPVVVVSWKEATAYTEWLSEQTGKSYRLPSEAEWEYAARAGTETQYWWGNEIGKNRANCKDCGSQWDAKQTAPVGSFAKNPFGLYDTVGNVWEWVIDKYHDSSEGAPTDGSAWDKTGSDRVLRGDSYYNSPHGAANRHLEGLDDRFINVGFRIAVTQNP